MTSSTQASSRVSESAARAHEQKNCLSIILAVATLVTPELSDGSRERMERLRAAAYRIRNLLNADLDSREDEMTTVDVEHLVRNVCDALRDRAEAGQVTLVADCGGGCVHGIEAELHEALFNVIANALEATPAHRAVFIRTERTPEGQVWTVHDSGGGMEREVLEKIGVPHRTFRPGGSGLGVALAKGIVERHGGAVRFASNSGVGTTVTIVLPQEARDALPLTEDASSR